MADSLADRLRGLLASDVYTEKGRLRADDLLVRERVRRGLTDAAGALRKLISAWRADRVPPSTRENPFPPAEVMEPIRRAERLLRALDDLATTVGGLPLISQDKVWDRVRLTGPQDLVQFDWTLVAESDGLSADAEAWYALDEVDPAAVEARLKRLREVIAERRRYLEILG